MTTSQLRNSVNLWPLRRGFLLILLVLVCFALLPEAQAVSPAPDGGYPGGNTAEGQNALQSTTTGGFNAALGFFSLFANTTGSFNTAVGAGALDLNTADNNTAIGAAALLLNTTGTDNTANGVDALVHNTTGSFNTATGESALQSNTTSDGNTAIGDFALSSNTTGNYNAAIGDVALVANTTGPNNTAIGTAALHSNTTGSGNIALGFNAGFNLTTGSNNIDIGNSGAAAESNTIRIGVQGTQTFTIIAGISNDIQALGTPVIVTTDGFLGVATSSARFKDQIKPMDKASEALLALKPVTFHYKKEIDPTRTSQFGLVAEEVEKVNPDLVVRDKEGKPYSVRYDQVNAMLLNEFLKEHRTVQELRSTATTQEAVITELKSTLVRQQKNFQATAAHQQKQIEALTAGLQKVNAQVEATKAAPQRVADNH